VSAYTTEGWGELFLADAGASAALAGLLFVAVSINLDRIIALRGLPGAALGAIVLLVAVLLVSTFGLVPGQPRWLLAGEVLVVGIAAWLIMTVIWIRALRAPVPGQPRFVPVLSTVVTQAATLPIVIAGVSLLLRAGGGLYWLVPGLAFCLVVAVTNAWVLLVEVVR
jgi:modulator of FtsH protease